jgi:SulP family sulfate permease
MVGALDGSAFALPLGLGAMTLVYGRISPDLLSAGLFAALMAIMCIHVAAVSARPLLYGTRIFEAATLGAMIDQVIRQLPAWGIEDTTGVRLAFLCLIGGCTGIFVALLYLMRADRFTRLIPTPVFAGFSNGIALTLFISQSQAIWHLVSAPQGAAPAITISLLVFAISMALRYWRPTWPGTTMGLAIGLVMSVLWSVAGHPTPTLGTFGWFSTLPASLADFGALVAPDAMTRQVVTAILVDSAILAMMVFMNTTMAAEVMTQTDGRRRPQNLAALAPSMVMTLTGLAGALPMSGQMSASIIAGRRVPLNPVLILMCAAIAGLLYVSGVAGLIPLAAVAGALLCEGWFMVDRASVATLLKWLRRKAVDTNTREDLFVIVSVTVAAVAINMVAAVFVGLLSGLLLFAMRNARRPVRHIWNGTQLNSNCARSRYDLRLLAEHGAGIHIVELEGDLFFGAIESLERALEQSLHEASSIVIDWSRVRHMDTSVARSFAQFEKRARKQGIAPVHGGAQARHPEIGALLRQHLPNARFAPDLDRALEHAENDVIVSRTEGGVPDATSVLEGAALLHGFNEAERATLEAAMPQKLFPAGEIIMEAGEPGDELMLVLHGSASVLVRSSEGNEVRLAGVRRGATFGDIAFLDQARRSATIVAEEDTTVAVLRRADFDKLSASHPHLVQQLLSNIALGLASQLRHTNRLALSRQGQH